jgi:hypothetical protein
MASDLSRQIEELEYDPDAADAFTLANMWTSSNDARGYAVIGDPAVRLPFGNGSGPKKAREEITVASFGAKPTTSSAGTDVQPAAAASVEGSAAVGFGFFGGGDDDKNKGKNAGEAEPGAFQSLVSKVVGTLSKAIEDATILEVRTYVSSNTGAAASADRATLAAQGDLRAFTRIMIDGDIEAIVPERDGAVDTQLWQLHMELVKQAQLHRAEMIKTVLSSIAGLIKP